MTNRKKTADWLHSIVKRYERPLCQYAYSILNNAETAREVVQDSFLKLCQQSRNRIEKKIPAWLFLVCRNRALDVIRKNKRMMELDEKQEAELVSERRRPDENAVFNENASIALKLLAKLPENQREVIRLKFQQELSYREIASVTKLSESNVGYLIHVGIKDLRGQMAVVTAN